MTRKLRLFARFALGLSAAALLMASAATADEPIASVGSGGNVDACLNDQHSGANPSATSPVSVNDRGCTASSSGSGGSGGSGASGGSGPQGGGGAAGPSGSAAPVAGSAAKGAGWVSAYGALGIRITSVRTLMTGVRTTKRFQVVVTLRDLNGKLVRGGIVKVDRVPGAVSTIRSSDATFTNRLGKARLVAAVSKKRLGTRVMLRISARTPKARALQLRSVYLPR